MEERGGWAFGERGDLARPLSSCSGHGCSVPLATPRLRGLRGFLTLLGFLERLWLATDMRPESVGETWFKRLRVIGCAPGFSGKLSTNGPTSCNGGHLTPPRATREKPGKSPSISLSEDQKRES